MAKQKNGMTRRAMLAAAGSASVGVVAGSVPGQEENQGFKANACTFEEGVAIVKKALEAKKVSINDKIVTSRDKVMKELALDLKCKNVPSGFLVTVQPIASHGAAVGPVRC